MAISIKADISTQIVFFFCHLDVEISQNLQSLMLVLFVPENDLIIWYAMSTFDFPLNRFTNSPNDGRCLVDTFCFTCVKANKSLNTEIIKFELYCYHCYFPTCNSWKVKKTKYTDHNDHLKQFKLAINIVGSPAVDENRSLLPDDDHRRCEELSTSLL